MKLGLIFFITCVSAKVGDFIKRIHYEKIILKGKLASAAYLLKPRLSNDDFLKSPNFKSVKDFGTYDFVVIGAGSAGSAVANRLSEIQEWKILVVEAGDEYDELPTIPNMSSYVAASKRNWGYTTRQDNAFLSLPNNTVPYFRGKIVGGTGAINDLIYSRGDRSDYDHWQQLGNQGWSYEDVLPYFKKSERMDFVGEKEYHGFDGPMNVAHVANVSKLQDEILKGCEDIGMKRIDYNGREQVGASRIQSNIRFGKRECGANRYIEPARRRKNFRIVTKALATEILIENREATGVRFVRNKVMYEVKVSKEVVLCAGVINTPQLLMLSGIGPGDDLTKLGIDVKVNLPVGKGFKDHVVLPTVIIKTNYTAPVETPRKLVNSFLGGSGWLTVASSVTGLAFMRTDPKLLAPDAEFLILPPSPIGVGTPLLGPISLYLGLSRRIKKWRDIQIPTILLKPKSSGSIRLASKNPKDFPIINVNMLDSPEDLETLYQAVLVVKKLATSPSLAKYGAQMAEQDFRQCKDFVINSREHWYCVMRHVAIPSFHGCCSVKMGLSTDPEACVDDQLRVHGVKKLRVADISVLPTILSGHMNAPAFMIGEKVADMIKKSYGKM